MMKLKLVVDNFYDVKQIETELPNLKLVCADGGSGKVSLYFDPDSGFYLEKGPLGRWDAMCYRVLGIKSKSDWKLLK